MKISQEKTILMQGEVHVDENEVWGSKGCGCFNFSCLKWRRYNNIDESDHQRGEEEHTEKWWEYKLNKLKQFSEKVAGPKWKNFIRKMGGYCHKRKCQKNRFQYDPHSYALNFDDGDDKEGDDLLRSSRFAAPFDDDRQRVRSEI